MSRSSTRGREYSAFARCWSNASLALCSSASAFYRAWVLVRKKPVGSVPRALRERGWVSSCYHAPRRSKSRYPRRQNHRRACSRERRPSPRSAVRVEVAEGVWRKLKQRQLVAGAMGPFYFRPSEARRLSLCAHTPARSRPGSPHTRMDLAAPLPSRPLEPLLRLVNRLQARRTLAKAPSRRHPRQPEPTRSRR